MQKLVDVESLDTFTRENPAALVYFHAPGCGVCDVLLPRVAALAETFPRLALADIDTVETPAAAAAAGVFTVPTVIVWFDGRESLRFARAFSMHHLTEAMRRPYEMLFG